ncbi:MAG: hypothetical protein Q4D71_11955 [Oscillospiraceae bacterium]|nr:hypothetical protein [Oscillospiraceae bacterium]
MISLDARRYYNIKDEYFNKVYSMIKNLKIVSEKNSQFTEPPIIVRELVYALYDFKLIYYLVDKKNDPYNLCSLSKENVSLMEQDKLEAAVRSLVLANVSRLKVAADYLNCVDPCDPNKQGFQKELEKYNSLRRNKNKSPKDEKKQEELKLKYGFIVSFADRSYINMRKQTITTNDGHSIYLPEYLVAALGIRTCPYCNRGYIGLTRGKLMGVQLDHFYNRNRFPFFAVSLFNLIPCCGVCNLKKSDKITKMVSPFEEGINFDKALHFTYDIPMTNTLGPTKGRRHLRIEISEENDDMKERYKENIGELELEAVYHFQEIEAEHFYEKMMAYPKSRLDEIVRHYNNISIDDPITVEGLEEALFREYFTEPADYIKKPLAKLYRDLFYEIRRWD